MMAGHTWASKCCCAEHKGAHAGAIKGGEGVRVLAVPHGGQAGPVTAWDRQPSPVHCIEELHPPGVADAQHPACTAVVEQRMDTLSSNSTSLSSPT